MEVVGTVLSVAQTLFAALQSSELKEIVSIFGYKDELEKLQNTVATIKAVFQDAERKQKLSAVELKLLEDLKDAVYEADDLIDAFLTLTHQRQLLKADGSVSKKMRSFISRTNPFSVAYKMSKGVKKIREKLDAIADNKRFSLVHDPEPIRKRRPETCSYVNEDDIIGRDQDLENILGMLLDPNVVHDLSFLSIVGIGGLGQTTLAQLVFNHPKVKSAFTLRAWACVSDEQKQLDVKEILGKILTSVNQAEGSTLVQNQSKLHQQLVGERYLVILDDVWTEKREEWRDLIQYFVGGLTGSWIMVTTRSKETARIIGDGSMYHGTGLSHSYRVAHHCLLSTRMLAKQSLALALGPLCAQQVRAGPKECVVLNLYCQSMMALGLKAPMWSDPSTLVGKARDTWCEVNVVFSLLHKEH